jgi:hypothetical protein
MPGGADDFLSHIPNGRAPASVSNRREGKEFSRSRLVDIGRDAAPTGGGLRVIWAGRFTPLGRDAPASRGSGFRRDPGYGFVSGVLTILSRRVFRSIPRISAARVLLP